MKIGASIVSVIATSSGAAAAYVRDRLANMRVAMFLELGTTLGAITGAYLAGILAARTTKTHKVGIVISASDDNWYKMSGGFAAGFRSVDKSSKIFFATVSPTGYDDAAGGKRVASSVIAQGADRLTVNFADVPRSEGTWLFSATVLPQL